MRAAVFADSVSTVSNIHGLERPVKHFKIIEINVSSVSKHTPSENGP
jgi:hypothetical protein